MSVRRPHVNIFMEVKVYVQVGRLDRTQPWTMVDVLELLLPQRLDVRVFTGKEDSTLKEEARPGHRPRSCWPYSLTFFRSSVDFSRPRTTGDSTQELFNDSTCDFRAQRKTSNVCHTHNHTHTPTVALQCCKGENGHHTRAYFHTSTHTHTPACTSCPHLNHLPCPCTHPCAFTCLYPVCPFTRSPRCQCRRFWPSQL